MINKDSYPFTDLQTGRKIISAHPRWIYYCKQWYAFDTDTGKNDFKYT